MIEARYLLRLARVSIQLALHRERCPIPADDPAWQRPSALFVTLNKARRLRGCVGSARARLPLARALIRYARRAAFKDPRFPPLQAAELPELRIHVSLLSALRELPCASDEELLQQLEPRHHGLLIKTATGSSLFLPSVWGQFPDAEFLQRLREKGNLGETTPLLHAWSFTVRTHREAD